MPRSSRRICRVTNCYQLFRGCEGSPLSSPRESEEPVRRHTEGRGLAIQEEPSMAMKVIPPHTVGQCSVTSNASFPGRPTIGTDLEMMYRRIRDLLRSPPTPELPDSGDGIARAVDIERLLAPLMQRPQDRTALRVRHNLALLHSQGLLDIDSDEELVTLPKERQS